MNIFTHKKCEISFFLVSLFFYAYIWFICPYLSKSFIALLIFLSNFGCVYLFLSAYIYFILCRLCAIFFHCERECYESLRCLYHILFGLLIPSVDFQCILSQDLVKLLYTCNKLQICVKIIYISYFHKQWDTPKNKTIS